MNSIITPLKTAIALAIFATLLASCEKKQEINYQVLAEDAAATENIFKDIFRVIDDESKNGQHSDDVGKTSATYRSHMDTCAIVILNTNGGVFPMSLSIDFGAGCTDAYGVNRKGKIVAVYSGPYRDEGSMVTISLENYYVNEFKVEGNEIITNDGRNSSGNLEFSVSVTNGVITRPDGGIITWESTRTNEWTEGESTTLISHGLPGICDDVYLITGFGQGSTSDGQSYRIDIDSPLEKQLCCRWISAGVLSVSVDGTEVATLDYGSGLCLPNANLTFGGNTIVVIVN